MTVNERVAKLEALLVGNGGKGLYEIEDEHFKEFKEFKKRFYAFIFSAISIWIAGTAVLANLLIQLRG
ncbi:unnamed protein product [marine sediment metagenome]|uniref:Uncharacterized protein n=1 Tax=marine sediment metagenome TaxID=412755 RepID=X0SWC6_9ZZZZ